MGAHIALKRFEHHGGKDGENGGQKEDEIEDRPREEKGEGAEIVGEEIEREGVEEDEEQPEEEGAPEEEDGDAHHARLLDGGGHVRHEDVDGDGDGAV